MAEQNVALLTMRRPGLAGGPRDEGVGFLTRPEGDGAGLRETRESLLEGGAVDVDSFPDAVRVAAVFYGQEDTDALVVVHVGGARGGPLVSRSGGRSSYRWRSGKGQNAPPVAGIAFGNFANNVVCGPASRQVCLD